MLRSQPPCISCKRTVLNVLALLVTWRGVIQGVPQGHVLHALPLPASIWALMRPDDQLQLVGP